jgi:hypothetical protein
LICLTHSTLSAGVTPNKNMGLCYKNSWVFHLGFKSSSYMFVYHFITQNIYVFAN